MLKELFIISEEKNLKERFGNLGLYLIDKAQNEIRKMNQEMLFQKAEIKKKYKEETIMAIKKLQEYFKQRDVDFLNSCLNSTLSRINQKMISFKNGLIEDLKKQVFQIINEKIKNKYPDYIKFLLNKIEEISTFMDKPQKIIIFFNSKDFTYFEKEQNMKKIKKLFKNPIEIKRNTDDFIGGFKAKIMGENLVYEFILDDLINNKSTVFQTILSEIFSDEKIEEISKTFKEYIESQKLDINLIEEYLSSYE